jgi:hypothetical protein
MERTEYSGTYGVYRYKLSVQLFVSWVPVLLSDKIIKNAADSSVVFFLYKSTSIRTNFDV